jgi:hypothetical protein
MTVLFTAPAATAHHCGTNVNREGEAVTVQCSHGESQAPTGPGRTYAPSELVKTISQVNGEYCTILASRTSDQGEREVQTRQLLDQFEIWGINFGDVWRAIVDSVAGCPGAPSPDAVAYSFIHSAGAPDPQPHVAPGHAVTGKTAYLETRGPTTHTQTFDTVLGPLSITFNAQDFTVDWGDGSNRDKGPFAAPGKPYPDGEAKHVYTNKGVVDITVTMRWSASWSVGGETGALEVTSTGQINDFEVRQLQAVRKR